MKLLSILSSSIILLNYVHAIKPATSAQFYPLNRNGDIPADLELFQLGQDIPLDCISRNIDNGEHKFDDKDRIIYVPFPTCQETNKPLSFKYGVNEDVNCTIGFTDELYHLFQLYIHEDSPFSCRLPLSNEPHYIEKGGAFIPLTFNFRGQIQDSHLDIDSHLNVLFTKPAEENTLISSVAWSSGTNATRIVIGDYLTINLAVRWLDNLKNTDSNTDSFRNVNGLPFPDGFYKLPLNSIPISYSMFLFYLGLVSLASGALVLAFSYNLISIKFSKTHYRNLDNESLVTKRD